MGLSSIILLLEKSPLLYHAYVFMTIFLWTRIVQNFGFMKSAWRELSNMPFKYIMNLLISSVAALFILEFLVCTQPVIDISDKDIDLTWD
jgi:phosphatidylinositol glycan class N